jgi:hypothetical protein
MFKTCNWKTGLHLVKFEKWQFLTIFGWLPDSWGDHNNRITTFQWRASPSWIDTQQNLGQISMYSVAVNLASVALNLASGAILLAGTVLYHIYMVPVTAPVIVYYWKTLEDQNEKYSVQLKRSSSGISKTNKNSLFIRIRVEYCIPVWISIY